VVDLALTGSASAPQVNDGNAATSSCADQVTIDLGRPRLLKGFGISLAGDAPSAQVTIEAGAQRITATVPVGTPAWLPRATIARTIRMSTTGGACVAELRAMGHGPRPIVGHDLSFAVQEAAAGATYTDRGRAALPEKILADHGADWVRLRLWVDPTGSPNGSRASAGSPAPARRMTT
jgi:Glycosyl hydrolase family 53